MRTRRLVSGVAIAATLALLPAPPTLGAPPATPDPASPVREFGNGAERAAVPAADPGAQTLRGPAHAQDPGHSRRTLPEPPVDTADSSIKLGLVPYHGIAPRLNALMRRSDRVSARIVGRSHEGRDLYLVTVTAPETRAQAAEQDRMRELIESHPDRAARDRDLLRRYKAPVFINNNIHGDEWEGTDASLRIIEDLATSNRRSVRELLGRTRLHFNVTANPDGRVAGMRTNAAGFDLNRDFVTGSQPEVRAMREIMIDTQPLIVLDMHGYVNGTLIEPATPPHGQNYEYDIYIKHTYANALGMEQAVIDLGLTPADDGVDAPQIPFRDFPEGWDDWPPIFTPMYAPYQGTVAASTIEIPLQVNREEYDQPVAELRRRSAINVDVAGATIEAAFDYAFANRAELIADQIEVFRRGAAGEPSVVPPLGWVPGFGPEDIWTTEFPRAYVIPAGWGQRSATAAARLVDQLIANDVLVRRAVRSFLLGGRHYPAGSYLVDMHQPKRGMANVMLEAGRDITPDIGQMYDISGWSLGLLWGATVDAIATGSPHRVHSRSVLAAAPTGAVPRHGALELRLDDGKDVAALNDLLAQGVEVRWTGSGGVLVPATARRAAAEMADRYGVRFRPATGTGGVGMRSLTVAAAAPPDELFTLRELGFAVTEVSTEALNAGFGWDGVDVLFVSDGLDYTELTDTARAALDAFLAGGGVVTRGSTGASFNAAAGLLPATVVEGREDANGVVRVGNSGSALGAGFADHTFVYSPLWFTDLGPGVTVEQRYATDGPLVAGHWRARDDGTGGQDAAAGQPSVVSGVAGSGAAVVLFGTEPLFRNHPKGSFAQVARALHWSAVTAAVPALP